jgi:TonB-linked SusC/RagA family outer membrane protein
MNIYVYKYPKLKGYVKIMLMIKLTFVILTTALLQMSSAASYSQTVTLRFKNAKLETVLKEIGAQAGVDLVYTIPDINESKPVSINLNKAALKEALEKCFADQALTYTLSNNIVIVKRKFDPVGQKILSEYKPTVIEVAPPITISGEVKDSEGVTLPGVSVKVKGTNLGTTTDISGRYSITVPDNSNTLVFTYIGYLTKEVVINGRNSIDVKLEITNTALGEIVVTALGIERESKSLTYAAQTIKGDELNQAKETNLINSLQGKVAGVVITKNATGPGGGSKVLIRGSRSVFGNNQPLYVIDGVPMDNSNRNGDKTVGQTTATRDGGDGIGMINSDNIETMTILKGASAAALYGSQGQNGAIVITTKRGKTGKISVDYTSNFQFENPLVLPEIQSEYGQGSGGIFYPSSETSWGPKAAGQSVTLWNGSIVPLTGQPNLIKDFFRTASSMTNSIGISGGTEKLRTYFSYGNVMAQGLLENQDYKRHNFDLNIENNISSKLSFFAKMSYIATDEDNKAFLQDAKDVLSSIYYAPVSIPLSEMQKYQYFDNLGNTRQSYWRPGSIFLTNPYWRMNRELFFENKERILGLVTAKYKFNSWLDLQLRGSIDKTDENTEEKGYKDSYGTSAGINVYNLFTRNRLQTNLDALLSFKKDLTNNINLTGNLGAQILGGKSKIQSESAGGLFKSDYFFMTNALNPTNSNSFENSPEIQSLYGLINLAYKNYLYMDITARNDWSSALPKENQSYFYPSVGLSAIVTDMIELPSWVSYGKARITLAKAGSGGDAYLTRNYFSVGRGGVINTPGVRSLGNYKPELTTSFEVGGDWRFFTNRLGIDFTYYKSQTKNQLMALAVPNATLFNQQYINAGLIQNQGLELMLNGTPIQSRQFSWNVMLNYSKNKNKVVRLTDRLKSAVLGGEDKIALETVEVGKSFGEIYMVEWKKDDQGRKLVNNNGIPLLTPKNSYAGNYNPDFMVGVTNSFTYSSFTLSFLLDYRHGGIVAAGTQAALDATGNSKASLMGRETGIVLDAYTIAGEKNTKSISAEAYWQSLGARSPVKDFYTYSATNLRLREFVLGYRLPNKLLTRTGFINNASLSLVGRNLVFLKRDAPFDPEIQSGKVDNRGGLEYSSLPTTRSIGLNLKMSF